MTLYSSRRNEEGGLGISTVISLERGFDGVGCEIGFFTGIWAGIVDGKVCSIVLLSRTIFAKGCNAESSFALVSLLVRGRLNCLKVSDFEFGQRRDGEIQFWITTGEI